MDATAPLNPFAIKNAVDLLQNDGVIAYPTESVYGLGCLPYSDNAIERILMIKRRPWHKGLLLVVSSAEQALPFIAKEARHLVSHFSQPTAYPVTWLFPASAMAPTLLIGDHDTVAIRLSKHPTVMALCDAVDSAIVSTSANRAGQPELRHAHQVRQQLSFDLDAVLAGAVGGFERPSAIIDATSGAVLRAYE